MPQDPNIASWLAGGAIAGVFGVLWWIAKRWIHLQEEQFDELHEKVTKIDDKKLDIAQFNGMRRVDENFDRLIAQQERAFAESRDERQRQSQKIEELVSCTQKFNMNMIERVARLERDN